MRPAHKPSSPERQRAKPGGPLCPAACWQQLQAEVMWFLFEELITCEEGSSPPLPSLLNCSPTLRATATPTSNRTQQEVRKRSMGWSSVGTRPCHPGVDSHGCLGIAPEPWAWLAIGLVYYHPHLGAEPRLGRTRTQPTLSSLPRSLCPKPCLFCIRWSGDCPLHSLGHQATFSN